MYSHPTLYKYYAKYKNLDSLFYPSKNSLYIKDIVVCGVQRSGSTYLFNIINEILQSKPLPPSTYFTDDKSYKKLLANERSTFVKKNHIYVPLLAKRIQNKTSIGFFTHRDIRDIVVSCIQLGWLKNIDDWFINYKLKNMMYNSILYASTPNMHIISYDELMNFGPQTVEKVADCLGIELSSDMIKDILNATSINATIEYIHKPAVLRSQKKYANLLKPNHIADGEIGKWKTFLKVEDQEKLNNFCKEYIDFFGYDKD